MECECYLKGYEGAYDVIAFCPLHEAAGELLEAAKRQVALIESEGMKEVQIPIASGISFQEALNKLRQAITKAEGGSK